MFHSVISRFLSVATVLTLVLFAANAGLQPAPALASPGISAPLGDTASFLNEDDNGNRGDEDDDNREGNENNENEHENNNENHENDDHDDNDGGTGTTGAGGSGIFFNICGLPWFAPNPGCALGLFGS